jgi:hypothetical protein
MIVTTKVVLEKSDLDMVNTIPVFFDPPGSELAKIKKL